MNDLPTISLMEAQVDFLMDDTTKFLALAGSYRSGKTFVACLKAIKLASMNISLNGLMLEPTSSMIQGVLVPTFEEVFDLLGWSEVRVKGKCWYEMYISQTNARIVLHFPTGDVTIFLRSSENWNRIRGFSVAWFIADEFDTSGYEICNQAWQKMVSRLTIGHPIQGCVTTTKEGFQWVYNYFVKNAASDRRLIDIHVKDNPFIDKDYIETMRTQLSEKQFKAYIENEFINFTEGNVYDAFDRIKNRTTETLAKHPHAPLSIGIDFNKKKMATVVAIIIGQIVHVVDEIYGCPNTESLIKEMKRKYPNRLINCFVDFSGSYHASSSYTEASLTDVQQLQQAFGGDNVKFYKGHLPIVGKGGEVNRVGIVNQKFCNAAGQRTLLINDTTCPNLTMCIEQQGYIDGKPDKANDIDHFPDALGYLISFIFLPVGHSAKIKVLQ